MDVMREAVEERAGEPLGAEHGRPLVERQIARDQRAAALWLNTSNSSSAPVAGLVLPVGTEP
jgi:hypothetical protein